MKCAVIGDLHGNHIALKSVLAQIKKFKIRKIFITGDFVGYYYHPDKVLQLLSKWDFEAVGGNHDAMIAKFINKDKSAINKYRSKFGKALDITIKKLTSRDIKFLVSLPKRKLTQMGGRKILLCHGSPWSQNYYVYPDAKDEIFNRFTKTNCDFVLYGHTHYPLVKIIAKTTIINSGSVGQPRDAGSLASWAIVDFSSSKVQIKRVEFNPTPLIKEVRKIDPDYAYLSEVLLRKNLNTVKIVKKTLI